MNCTSPASFHRVGIPVIASGGAGKPDHLLEVLSQGRADAALIAFHGALWQLYHQRIKEFLDERGVKVRKTW